MSAFTKFNAFSEALSEKKHNLGSDQLKIALCATANAPVATNGVLADLTQIAYTNLSTRNVTTSTSSQTSGTYSLVIADLVLTASGGAVAAFQYCVIYNDTATNDELIGFYDIGQAITLQNGDTYTLDFPASGVLTLV